MIAEPDSRNYPQKRHTRDEWLAKFHQAGERCHFCEKPLTLATATKEHLTPRCRGGSDAIENVVPACWECNQMKLWRTEAEFLEERDRLLSTRRARIGGIPKPKPSMLSLEEKNEPGLLKTLVMERETKSTWWRSA